MKLRIRKARCSRRIGMEAFESHVAISRIARLDGSPLHSFHCPTWRTFTIGLLASICTRALDALTVDNLTVDDLTVDALVG